MNCDNNRCGTLKLMSSFQISFGEMVCCDNPDCKVEWFHFQCVGMISGPPRSGYLKNLNIESRFENIKLVVPSELLLTSHPILIYSHFSEMVL